MTISTKEMTTSTKRHGNNAKTRAIASLLLLSPISANAAVTFSASLEDNPNGIEIELWSRASTIKTQDIDGDNLYGSDGYVIMNTANISGPHNPNVLHNIVSSTPSYTSDIVYSGAGAGDSGSYPGAEDMRNPTDTGDLNVGYAGFVGAVGAANTLQALFSYKMNRNMIAGEVIRLGVIADSLGDPEVGITSLRIIAGGVNADATMVAGHHNGSMDMYFFDVRGLSSGDDIEIWGSNGTSQPFVTIGGVMFDSIPEPSSALLVCFGGLGLLIRRRR